MLNLHTTYLFKGRVFTNCTDRMRIRITRRNLYQGGKKWQLTQKMISYWLLLEDFSLVASPSCIRWLIHILISITFLLLTNEGRKIIFLPTNRSWGEGRKQYLLPLLSKIKSNLNFCFISNPIVQEAELSVS